MQEERERERERERRGGEEEEESELSRLVWLSLLSGEICEICVLGNGRCSFARRHVGGPSPPSLPLPSRSKSYAYFEVSLALPAGIALVREVSFNLTASMAAAKRHGEELVGRLAGRLDQIKR